MNKVGARVGEEVAFSIAFFKLMNPSQINVSSVIKFIYYLG
jgi:hypothetical protein